MVPSGVDIVPIQLPGRERRVREPFEYSLFNMAEHIADTIEKISADGTPFSVFGHSMGEIIAFETVKLLEKRNINPVKCFISATDLRGISALKSVSEMNEDELLKLVSVYGAAQDLQSMKRFPQYFTLFMRIIRADFMMLENYNMDITEKISTPVIAIYFEDDKLVNCKNMKFWESMTVSDFLIVNFPGGHFFLFDDSRSLVDY